jgi:GH15 family glucan-1,4-alpha-glucosidase
MSKTLNVEGTQSATVAYYYGIADSLAGAKLLADGMHSKNDGSTKAWGARSSNQWREWLSSGKGKSLDTPVRQWSDAFRIALVTNRQSQQPEFGSFVAATNPAYDYKVWPRDSSVTAMSFDAAGYLDQAEKYWIWMADVQADGTDETHPAGTWWTNYRYTARNEQIPFVEPELDCIGLFLVGAYRHYELLKERDPDRARQFLEKVWPAAERSAGFISNSVNAPNNFGFGPADFSIWEEELEFAVFTQTTYAAGLRAAELLAQERDDEPRAQAWAQARQTIVQALLRDTGRDPCPGAWSDKNYFIRGVRPDCTLDQRVDGATGLLWVLGVLDAEDPRTELHRRALVLNLKRGDFSFGLARYEGDEFYHASPYSPGGMFEANATMPVWPQMSMYMAMLEHWTGMDEDAEKRLSWYVATTNLGYQPAGEAVDWTTERPLSSTASEPVTAAWYQLALLNQLGMFDPRLP